MGIMHSTYVTGFVARMVEKRGVGDSEVFRAL